MNVTLAILKLFRTIPCRRQKLEICVIREKMFLEITFTTDGEISPRFKLVFDFAEYLRILLEY